MLLQQLVNGIVIGLTYALLALGMSLAFGTTRVVNFAHGEFFTLGAFVGLTLQRRLDMPFLVASLGAIGIVFGLSAVLANMVFWRLRTPLERSVATIAVGLGLRDSMLLVFGSDSASFAPVFPVGSIELGPVFIPRAFLVVAVIAVGLFVLFDTLVRRTRFGIWMRATADDPELASVLGIPTRRVQTIAFGIAGGLAAAAGLLVGPTWQVSYAAGIPVALKGYTAAVIGGLGDLRGAFLGGILLGCTEAILIGYVSSTWKDLCVYTLLIAAMLTFPRGIFAAKAERLG